MEVCIKLVIWKKSVLWCTVRKTSNYDSKLYRKNTYFTLHNFFPPWKSYRL